MGFPPVRRRAGDKPDPTRPLRSEPVRHDEVRLVYKYDRLEKTHYCHHLTMPLGTYTVESRNGDKYYVGDPPLWRAVLDQLAAEFDAQYQAALARHAYMLQNPLAAIRQMRPQRKYLPKAEIVVGIDAREFRCEHCGRQFLGVARQSRYPVLCSDQCARARRAALQRQWHEAHPRRDYLRQYHRGRGQQRADARAGRTCEYCGVAIEAARSTKRFCSGRCRIRAHHQRHKEAATG